MDDSYSDPMLRNDSRTDVDSFIFNSQKSLLLQSSLNDENIKNLNLECTVKNHKGNPKQNNINLIEYNNSLSRAEFSRRIDVLRSWYNDLPIIRSRRSLHCKFNFSESDNICSGNVPHKPVLFETPEGLDIRFVLGMLTDILSCALCKGGLICPTCYTPIPADILEGIEYDHNIQGLVDKIFPRFTEIESEQKRLLSNIMGINSSDISVDLMQNNIRTDSVGSDIDNGMNNPDLLRIIDSTSNFLEKILKDKSKFLNLFQNSVSCIALLHEMDDATFEQLYDDLNTHIDYNTNDVILNGSDTIIYPRKYICVPKNLFIADIINYLIHTLALNSSAKLFIILNDIILPKNHTIEFICKSRRIDMTKCIILRYKVVE